MAIAGSVGVNKGVWTCAVTVLAMVFGCSVQAAAQRAKRSETTWSRTAARSVLAAGSASPASQRTVQRNSIWLGNAVPSVPDVGPDSPVELGVSFRADSNGYITGIRFYKSAGNTGTHVGNLWTSTGTLLATVVFTAETASGWQQASLSTPVAVTANTTYVASYHTTAGHYSASWNYFAAAGVNNAPLHALQDVSGTPNGRFAYGSASVFPANSHQSANYWVDVTFNRAPSAAPWIHGRMLSKTVAAGQMAAFTVIATGAAPLTYQWQKNGTPIAGATSAIYITPATTPSDSGTQFRVVVSNAAGSATSNAVSLTVTSSSPSPLQISTSHFPGGTLAGAYSATLAAFGGLPPYSWSLLSGQLPTGLSLSSSGTISGTPTLAGSFSFMVQVKDAAAHSASGTFSINVVTPVPAIAITAPASGAVVSGSISVTGTASDAVNLVSVQVSIDNGSFLNASGTTGWTYNLNTASLSNGTHTLQAEVKDVAGITATSSPVTFTVSNGTLAADCTLFASASGNDGNPGTSASAPKTFSGAASVTQPGSVVCLLAGTYSMTNTFYPPTSGSPSSWIVYKSYGNGAVNFVWNAGAIAQPMFKFGSGSFPSNPAYLEFRGLNLDGQNNALDGFFCNGAHHLRFIGNTINNTGGSGVGAVSCDYLTSDHNLINHNGYLYGWTSGISYNNDVWFDNYPGFHNIIANNIVVGEFDGSSNHTDGNGIILDLGGNTPPALIINNVVYGNGGRCIQSLNHINFWIVNNTCYKNNLDPSLGNAGSFTTQGSSNGYFINNIVVAWHTNNPSYDQEGSNSNISYYADMYFGSSPNFTPSAPAQLIQADPLFVNPPVFDPTALGQYATALPPSQLGNRLALLPTSPAYNRGIDPSTLSGLPANIVSDLKQYIYVDINGKARPQGGGCDLGAYQH